MKTNLLILSSIIFLSCAKKIQPLHNEIVLQEKLTHEDSVKYFYQATKDINEIKKLSKHVKTKKQWHK